MSHAQTPPLLNVHTPSSSFTVVHSTTEDTLDDLYHKLQKKVDAHPIYGRNRHLVGPGWLKYKFNGTAWNLDDGEIPRLMTHSGRPNRMPRPRPRTTPQRYTSTTQPNLFPKQATTRVHPITYLTNPPSRKVDTLALAAVTKVKGKVQEG
ncbi:hypothetical protein V5O48_004052 [Marasmius crinis-equi]|uniref:Uncharacterized protein n=1 Tax=Marasmius crinis-equi TaxID=585013 RepID=A0ABR3FR52_9AGAR